jgi:flagellar hook-basal body complex protein FliE
MTLPISNIAPIEIPGRITPAGGPGSDSSGLFSGMLQNAMGSLESLQAGANTNIQKFLTGENEDLHTTVLATQRAEMAFELGLQVRNKVVSAYQEIMKMQL